MINKILERCTGTPYLALFNARLEPILDPVNLINIGSLITSFEYEYSEEKSDKGEIEIHTDNTQIVDLEDLGYRKGLQIQWGWLYPDGRVFCGPARKVVITGLDYTFDKDGVKVDIEVSDRSVFLKTTASNHYNQMGGFLEYFKDLCKGVPIGVEVVDYEETSKETPMLAQRVQNFRTVDAKGNYIPNHLINSQAGAQVPSPSKDGKLVLNQGNIIQDPTILQQDATGVKLIEWDPTAQALTVSDPNNFMKVYLEEYDARAALINGTSRTKYAQFRDVSRVLSNGPFFVDSRDDMIVIHNAKLARDISKVYDFHGPNGEMLSFKISSKFVTVQQEVKQSTEIDPDTKDLSTTTVQGILAPDGGNFDSPEVDAYIKWGSTPGVFWGMGKPGGATEYPVYNPNVPQVSTPVNDTTPTAINNVVSGQSHADNSQSVKTFNSKAEAIQYYQSNPEATSAEIQAWLDNMVSEYNKKLNQSETDIALSARKLDEIPTYKIRRVVNIVQSVNLINLADKVAGGNYSREEFSNAVTSGQLDLSSCQGPSQRYQQRYNYLSNPQSIPSVDEHLNFETTDEVSRHRQALQYINAIPGVKILGSTGNKGMRQQTIEYQLLLDIDINGIDLAAGADSINLSASFGGDITDSIRNRVKAKATVIGDPTLESSMNVQIQGISKKYDGLWYTKKVTHKIDKSGYTCDIELVERNIPISTTIIQAIKPKTDYGKELLETINTAKETGDWNNVSEMRGQIHEAFTQYPSNSFVIQIDPANGNQIIMGKYDMSRSVQKPTETGQQLKEIYKKYGGK